MTSSVGGQHSLSPRTMKLLVSLIWLFVATNNHSIEPVDSAKTEQSNEQQQAGWKTPGRQLLAGPDFRLSARAWIQKPGKLVMLSNEIVTDEFYSNSKQSGLVQLHRVDENDREQIDLHAIYHYHNKQIIQNPTHRYGKKCATVTADQLGKDLFGSKIKIAKNWLKEKQPVVVPDYVVGFGRLLLLVDHHRDSLERDDAGPSSSSIRNHQVIRYRLPSGLETQLGLGESVRIHYAETRENYGGFDLPMRIQFTDKDGSMLTIDYSLIGPMETDIIEQVDVMNPLDKFAVPIGIGCSEQMSPVDETTHAFAHQIVSFRVQIFKHNRLGTKQTSISRRFVAYDSYAGAMRSDAITAVSYSITIVDLWQKQKYNIMVEDGTDQKLFMNNPCVLSKLADSNLYLSVLPFEELVFMGLATIRGIECLAFEHTTSQLPPALFPTMTFTNLEGREEAIFGRDSNTYQVVYYFARKRDESEQTKASIRAALSGPLMRIDVYCKKVLQYHMDVFDYINQLSDAPNGDRQGELFALKDRCSSGRLETDGYASLALELTYKPASKQPLAAQQISQILQNARVRNKATLRALARGYAGIIGALSDTETQMRLSTGGELKLQAEARLSLPDVEVSAARQVGWSRLDSGSTEVKTIEECFQWAAHAQTSPSPVLFVSCANSCNVATKPVVEYDGDEIKSIKADIYKPDPKRASSQSCPAMLVEKSKKIKLSEGKTEALRLTYSRIRSDLDGKILRLVLPQQTGDDTLYDDLLFEVTKVDIYSDKWSAALGYEKTQHQEQTDDDAQFKLPARGLAASIDGLGLTEASGQLQQPRQKDSSAQEEQIMNLQMCRAICMSKLSCRSFSVCVTRRGTECVISEVDFRDKRLLEALESRLGQEKHSQHNDGPLKIKTIQVANPKREESPADELDDAASGLEQIELRVDFRCKLYKKNALEMFHKLRPSAVRLKNSALMPVGNQEECAEICLRNNMMFFKQMAATRLKLMQNNEAELDDDYLVKALRDDYNGNLKNWCSTAHFIGSTSPDLDKSALSFINPKKLEKAGLCVIANPLESKRDLKKIASKSQDSSSGDSSSKEPNEVLGPRVPFETFQFLYSNLFDVQYGIRLEEAAEDDRGKQLPLINKSRLEYARDAESCAQRCFLQLCGSEFLCKSFDFIEMRIAGTETAKTTIKTYCEFHSVSLAEVRLLGLAEFMVIDLAADADAGGQKDAEGLTKRAWHYDSIEAYTLEDAVLSELVLARSEATLLEEAQAYRLHAAGIMMVLLAAAILSAAIVVLHGERLVNKFNFTRRDSSSDPSRSFLGSIVTGSNQSTPASAANSKDAQENPAAGSQDLPNITELHAL